MSVGPNIPGIPEPLQNKQHVLYDSIEKKNWDDHQTCLSLLPARLLGLGVAEFICPYSRIMGETYSIGIGVPLGVTWKSSGV